MLGLYIGDTLMTLFYKKTLSTCLVSIALLPMHSMAQVATSPIQYNSWGGWNVSPVQPAPVATNTNGIPSGTIVAKEPEVYANSAVTSHGTIVKDQMIPMAINNSSSKINVNYTNSGGVYPTSNYPSLSVINSAIVPTNTAKEATTNPVPNIVSNNYKLTFIPNTTVEPVKIPSTQEIAKAIPTEIQSGGLQIAPAIPIPSQVTNSIAAAQIPSVANDIRNNGFKLTVGVTPSVMPSSAAPVSISNSIPSVAAAPIGTITSGGFITDANTSILPVSPITNTGTIATNGSIHLTAAGGTAPSIQDVAKNTGITLTNSGTISAISSGMVISGNGTPIQATPVVSAK